MGKSLKAEPTFLKKQNAKSGFSLFEVLVAMAILSSASMLLYMAWSGNQLRVQKIRINNQAALLLNEIIAELEIKYSEKLTQLPEKESGTFENHPNFTWEMESKDFEMPDLRAVLVSGNEDNNEMMLMIVDRLTEFLNQSVKEMRVTVKYSIGKKSSKYSATSLLVDYNRSIPMGIPSGGGGAAGGLGQ